MTDWLNRVPREDRAEYRALAALTGLTPTSLKLGVSSMRVPEDHFPAIVLRVHRDLWNYVVAVCRDALGGDFQKHRVGPDAAEFRLTETPLEGPEFGWSLQVVPYGHPDAVRLFSTTQNDRVSP